MTSLPLRIGILAGCAMFALVSASERTLAGGGESPSSPVPPREMQPPKNQAPKKKKQQKTEQEFLTGYKQAHLLVEKGQFADAIAAFKDLDEDDHPDVANYIGFSYRKLGDLQLAKVWYERALAAEPNHLRTWQYYGLWQVQNGDLMKAGEHLERVKALCGTTDCKEYQDLKNAIDNDGKGVSY